MWESFSLNCFVQWEKVGVMGRIFTCALIKGIHCCLSLFIVLQRAWRKKRYQYLQYFMLPKHLRYEPEPEFNTGLVGVPVDVVPGANEDSNGSNNNSNEKVRNYRFFLLFQNYLQYPYNRKSFVPQIPPKVQPLQLSDHVLSRAQVAVNPVCRSNTSVPRIRVSLKKNVPEDILKCM